MKNQAILVTGSHRSGTTWVGKVINMSNQVRYIHEPFNKVYAPIYFNLPKYYWYPFITKSNNVIYQEGIEKIIQRKSPDFRAVLKSLNSKIRKRIIHDYLNVILSENNSQTLIKDPLAIFASEWLYQNFNTTNIIMIRSPLAFVSSLKKHNWQFDFFDLYNQKELIQQYFIEYEDQIKFYTNHTSSIVEQGILLYNIIYSYVLRMQKNYPHWLFIKHEDLSRNSIIEFKKIFKYTKLDFTQKIENYIIQTTSDRNPKDRNQNKKNGYLINSRESLNNWKTRLNDEEIDLIVKNTSKTYSYFYHDTSN